MPTRQVAQPDASTCSAYSARLDEPLAGTAPVAATWLIIEQPGPWGARALTESHLDERVGAALNARTAGTGVRIGLVRRVGHHVAAPAGSERTVLISAPRPSGTTVRSLTVTDPRALLDLDFAALGQGRVDVGTAYHGQAILVCTNGKRDRCCALLGRSLAQDVADSVRTQEDLDVWEADHLGGHRFAPTALVLSTGYLYGRLNAADALLALERAAKGLIATGSCRGRSLWSRPGQVADLALRTEQAQYRADGVEVTSERRLEDGRWEVEMLAAAARYRAVISEHTAVQARPESCGKDFGHPTRLRVDSLEPLP